MSGPRIRVVREAQFGGACLEAVLDATALSRAPVVGLPTGNTPVAFYAALARAVNLWDADVSSWRPVAIDEYGGPREHPCSNRRFFRAHWDSIRGAPAVEQFDPEAHDQAAECARMREVFEGAGGLDVAILGVGINGHMAFNEPGSDPESSVRRVDLHPASRGSARACWGDDAPAWGFTLGLRELLGARHVVVMANGLAKAGIVARALEGPQSADCPASFARMASATWVLDQAAASELTRTR